MMHQRSYLWEPPHGRYFLVGSSAQDYAIWDSLTDMVVVIEDDDEYDQVIARMEKAGVPILPKFSEGPHRGGASG